MSRIILINKPRSFTPLQTIQKLQKIKPEYADLKIGYAGRLDPMAEGLLLLLIGDENKKRKEYERLDKEYEFEVLLGVETDSYDALGIIEKVKGQNPKTKFEIRNLNFEISQLLKSFIGSWDQPYPPYSAARVNGKPLYYWAREGRLDEIKIPSKQITISKIELLKITQVQFSDIYEEIIQRVQSVEGTFRQKEIVAKWNKTIQLYNNVTMKQLSCTISCSSGTYVRSIAHSIGKALGVGGIAWHIKRTKIGTLTLKKAIQL